MKLLVIFSFVILQAFASIPTVPDRRIVGGNDARPEQFPYLVSMRRTEGRRHICGGAIVNVKIYFLTSPI